MLTYVVVKPVNNYLEKLSRFHVSASGSLQVANDDSLVILDATKLENSDAVLSFLSNNKVLIDRIASLTISGTKLSSDHIVDFLRPTITGAQLVELNLSYMTLNNDAVDFLCTALNTVSGHNNQIKRLILTRCDIGMYNLQKIIYALCENITLQELIITCNNRCNDELFVALKKYTLFSRNSLVLLGIGGNNITWRGILELCDILSESATKLTEIQLNGNDIDDTNSKTVIDLTNNGSQVPTSSAILDKLILSIHTTNKIELLNLSNCNIGCLGFTRYLPFMYTLTTLILSHNRIDDNQLVKIGSNLEHCICLRHLDLSYNCFGGLKCCLLQKFFETNQYLFSLNLRGNCLLHAVWKSFSFGLMYNSTLQSLDICNCELTLEDAMVMCFCFTTNEVLTIDMNNNNLPNELMYDPRRYCIQTYRTAATPMPVMSGDTTVSMARSGGNNNRTYLMLCPQAIADSIPRSRAWRADRIALVQQSVEAIEAATLRKVEKSLIEDSSQSIVVYDKPQISMDVVMMGDSHSQILFPNTPPKELPKHYNENPENLVYINNANKVAQTGELVEKAFFVSLDTMQGMIDEADMANTMEPQTVSISYGRVSANLLGTMTLTGFTTYYEAAAYIKPLVAEHLCHVIEANREKLVNGFTLLDPSGNIVPKTEMKLRKIWPEMCSAVAYIKSQHSKDDNIDNEIAEAMTIVVRPANWITLPPEGE